MDWEKLLINYGLPTVMVIYFMWRDYKRDERRDTKEDAVGEQFAQLNKQQFELTTKCIEAVTVSNELARGIKQIIEEQRNASNRKTSGHPILHPE